MIEYSRPIPGWERLQKVLNEGLRCIAVESNPNPLSVVVDNDKIWLNSSGRNAGDRYSLKYVRHTRDNRDGLVAHTAVTTAMCVPLNIQMEKQGDSAHKCYERVMAGISGVNVTEELNCLSMETNFDRGYAKRDKFERSMKMGTDIDSSTWARGEPPFTYNQEKRSGDTRMHLSTTGTSSLFVKEARVHNRRFTVVAFKNGTDSISIAASTKYSGHAWEGIPLNNLTNSPHESNYIQSLVEGKYEDEKAFVLEHLNQTIKFVTIKQGTPDWHLLRKFSFSSSHGLQSRPYFHTCIKLCQ